MKYVKRFIQEVIMPFKPEKPDFLYISVIFTGFSFKSAAILFNKKQSIFL